MPHRFGAYLHPWDLRWLDARGGLSALADLGFADVAFPASYHAGTWTTPVGDDGMVRRLEDGVVYVRPTADYGALRPMPSSVLSAGGPSPVEACVAAATAAGVESHAWTILFHNTPMGLTHPESCCRNASGDIYEYSLCPSRPEVQQYGAALVADVAATPGLTTVEVEAMGFMGYRHGGHHVKRSFPVDPYLDFLLSYCFCDHCQRGLAELQVDPEGLRQEVVRRLRARLHDGDAMEPVSLSWQASFDTLAEHLGRKRFLAMIRHRTVVYVGVLNKLRAAMPEAVRLSVHLNMDPLFSGSQVGQPIQAVRSLVDEIVVTHYGDSASRIAEKWAGQGGIGERTRISIWPKAPEFRADKDLVAILNLLETTELDGLRLYHLGLLPWRTVERVMKTLTA